MRFLLLGFGSRGDVQPMIELGRGLRAAGHDDVSVVAWMDFEPMVRAAGLGFEPFHLSSKELLELPALQAWLSTTDSPREGLKRQGEFMAAVTPTVATDLLTMVRADDVVVNGLLTADCMAALAPARGAYTINAHFCPLLPSAAASACMMPPVRGRSPLNRAASTLGMRMYAGQTSVLADEVRAELGLSRRTTKQFMTDLRSTPTLLAVSPIVLPPPGDWPDTLVHTGWWARRTASDYEPPAELAEFLAAGPPPVFVSFGSMNVVSDPVAEAELVIAALTAAGVRGIIDRGLMNHNYGELPDRVYAMSDIPHDWLFPQCAAVVHHGGSGTTGAAFASGVPALVVPHIGDQGYFARRTHELECGPAPIPRSELTADDLGETIRGMVTDIPLRARARAMGRRIAAEDGVAKAVRQINDWLEHAH